jgi:hypothetical protein
MHNYHDHAFDTDEDEVDEEDEIGVKPKGRASQTFPMKLHSVLEQVEADGFAHIVSWQSHGRCFVIHKPNVSDSSLRVIGIAKRALANGTEFAAYVLTPML